MSFLYHRVPVDMHGTTLHPLNALKDIHPNIYEKEFKKYEGRLHVPQQHVPVLNCLWNDVLHLTSVPPADVKRAHNTKRELTYYQIDPHTLEQENTIVYLFKKSQEHKYDNDNWAPYDPDNIDQYATIPERAHEYFAQMAKEGKPPLMYMWVPHILYKGSIDVSNASIVTV